VTAKRSDYIQLRLSYI